MIYLKKFNENIGEFYIKVDEDEFANLSLISFEDGYLENLQEFNTKYVFKYKNSIGAFFGGYDSKLSVTGRHIIGSVRRGEKSAIKFKDQSERSLHIQNYPQDFIFVEIFEMIDEWFIVSFTNLVEINSDYVYYKCDQWNGVIKLLKDNKIL